jgi:hypothetical protein
VVLVTCATGRTGRQTLSQLQDRGAGASRGMLLAIFAVTQQGRIFRGAGRCRQIRYYLRTWPHGCYFPSL